jgi:hypothetical protein
MRSAETGQERRSPAPTGVCSSCALATSSLAPIGGEGGVRGSANTHLL